MMALNVQAAADHRRHHLGAEVLIMIGGRDREISFLVARTVAEVVGLTAGAPAALLGIAEIGAVVLIRIEPDAIEDEELGLGPKVGGVGDAAVVEVLLGLAGDPAGIALVVL